MMSVIFRARPADRLGSAGAVPVPATTPLAEPMMSAKSRMLALGLTVLPLISGCGGEERTTVASAPLFDDRRDADQFTRVMAAALLLGSQGQRDLAEGAVAEMAGMMAEVPNEEVPVHTTLKISECLPPDGGEDTGDIKLQICKGEVLHGRLAGQTGYINGSAFERWSPGQ